MTDDTKTFRLCYIDPPWAWFTTAPITGPGKQWGDDWNDSPYEHNAGEPYGWLEHIDGKKGRPRYWLREIGYTHPYLETPAERANWFGQIQSNISVERINDGEMFWLAPYSETHQGPRIRAGTTLEEFTRLILDTGGAIYWNETDVRVLVEGKK